MRNPAGFFHVFSGDSIPNAFTFTDVSAAARNTTYTSNTITISGINTATTASVSGGTISINGGAFGSGGTITNGQTLQARGGSGSNFGDVTNVVVNVGGVVDTYTITVDAMPAWLNLINATSAGAYLDGNTFYFPNSLNGNSFAMATSLTIPQDDNWYYYEWDGNSGSQGGATGTQTAANQSAGVIVNTGQYDLSTWKGIAIRYSTSNGTYYNVPIRASDGLPSAGPNTMAGALVMVCAGVHCTKDVATGTYASATLLPYGFQHAYAPDIYTLACGGNTFHNYPTYPLLS